MAVHEELDVSGDKPLAERPVAVSAGQGFDRFAEASLFRAFCFWRFLEGPCYASPMTKNEHRQLITSFVTLDDAIACASDALANGRLAIAERALKQARQTVYADAPTLTVPEVAEQLGISHPTARSWIAKGLLDSVPGTSPQRVKFASVQELKERLARLRTIAKDERRFSALLREAADQRALRQPGAHEGLQDALAGNTVEI